MFILTVNQVSLLQGLLALTISYSFSQISHVILVRERNLILVPGMAVISKIDVHMVTWFDKRDGSLVEGGASSLGISTGREERMQHRIGATEGFS